jgi:hypothetical protein
MALYRGGWTEAALIVLPAERDVERLAQLGVFEGEYLAGAGEQFALRQLFVGFGDASAYFEEGDRAVVARRAGGVFHDDVQVFA